MASDGLSAGAAARRLGVAVTTLRTWHQRYGLGPSQHEPGHHRRYTIEDMVRLQVMQRLTAQGVAPAEAAAWAQQSLSVTSAEPSDHLPAPPGSHALFGDPPMDNEQIVPLGPRADPVARGLGRAAMRLDTPAMRYILESAITHRGVLSAWTKVIMPVLIGIGERYEATTRFIEVERLLSRSITEALSTVPRPPRDIAPRALLAAADEEQHTLPLEALAAALAENGIPSRLMGARVPPRALLEVVARTDPAVVVLWSQLSSTGDVTQLVHLLDLPHPPAVVAAAGPGWPASTLPPTVTFLNGLADAVRVVWPACT